MPDISDDGFDSDADSDSSDSDADSHERDDAPEDEIRRLWNKLSWPNENFRLISRLCNELSLSERDCHRIIRTVSQHRELMKPHETYVVEHADSELGSRKEPP